MTFRVGMKVQVIAPPDGVLITSNDKMPKLYLGQVVTIRDYDTRAFKLGLHSIPTVRLEEIVVENAYFDGFGHFEMGYRADCFRPLTDTKQEVSFTTGADPDSEIHDNRRRAPVREVGASA